jgi:hypothetical protein
MTEQQEHLKAALSQQTTLIDEIQKLSNAVNTKREIATKLQGVIEYLTGMGISLPPEEIKEEIEPSASEESSDI